MKKSCVSVLMSVVLMLTMLLGVMIVPVSAANTASLIVSETAGELGETVDVTVSVSADSYIVNGDFDLSFDSDVLRYIPDSCEASALLTNAYWAANESSLGVISISFASDASVGITDAGVLFTLSFEIVNKNAMQADLILEASPLRGCNGGDDFDIKPVITNGKVGIVGGADPWNFLQAAFLESGHENVSIDANGVWTVTGDFTLSPDFTMDYSAWSHIAQKFTSNTPVKITLVDRDPQGVYGEHNIGLYDNFVGPSHYPANSYDRVDSVLGIYNWNITNGGWKNTGVATIDQVIVDFEKDDNVSAVFTSLYMSQGALTTASVVRTTATKATTTTTTKVYNMTFTVETVGKVGSVAAGETIELDITVSEMEAVCGLSFVVNYDPALFTIADASNNNQFFGYISNTMPAGMLGYSLESLSVGDVCVENDTVLATVRLTALKDVDADTVVTLTDVKAFRFAPGVIECSTVDGGVDIVKAVQGDVSADGIVDAADATALFYFINNATELDVSCFGNADVNGDGQITLTDAARLFYMVNGLL